MIVTSSDSSAVQSGSREESEPFGAGGGNSVWELDMWEREMEGELLGTRVILRGAVLYSVVWKEVGS